MSDTEYLGSIVEEMDQRILGCAKTLELLNHKVLVSADPGDILGLERVLARKRRGLMILVRQYDRALSGVDEP